MLADSSNHAAVVRRWVIMLHGDVLDFRDVVGEELVDEFHGDEL
jgi:hypothetical protein